LSRDALEDIRLRRVELVQTWLESCPAPPASRRVAVHGDIAKRSLG
jgi:hypothetical protein